MSQIKEYTKFHQTQPQTVEKMLLKLVIRKFQIPNIEIRELKNLYSIFFNHEMVPLEYCHVDTGN
jgi:hypothetical protein